MTDKLSKLGDCMAKIEYKRDFPGGGSEFFEDVIKKPSEEHVYFDDMLLNHDERSSLPIKFYNFGKERSYPLRTIRHTTQDKFIFHYVTDGWGSFKGERIGRGQGFVMFPDTVDTMSADHDNPWHFCWMVFGGRDAYGLLRSVGITEEKCIFEYDFCDKVNEIFEELLYSEHSDLDMDMYMYSRLYELMAYHKKLHSGKMLGGGAKQGYVRQAINYIDENYAAGIKIEDIAKRLHISRKYLCRIFIEYRGISPKEYLLTRRVEEAARLLSETDLGVAEIAHLVGYGDYTQLSSLFKSQKGCSPQQFRALSSKKK